MRFETVLRALEFAAHNVAYHQHHYLSAWHTARFLRRNRQAERFRDWLLRHNEQMESALQESTVDSKKEG